MRLIDADDRRLRADLWTYTRDTGIDEAPFENAIKAIDNAPTIEPSEDVNKVQTSAEPSGDLISRADAIDRLNELHREVEEVYADDYDRGTMHGLVWATDILKGLPSADTMSIEEHQQIVTELKQSYQSGDLISRQWLLDLYEIDTTDFKETANVPLEVVIQNIKDAPSVSAKQTIIGIDIPYGSDKGLATVFKGKDDKLILEKVKEICLDDFTDRPSVSIQPKTIANDCDLISRADVIETVQAYLDILINSRRHGDDVTLINVLTDIQSKLSALPSADRPQGEDWDKYSEKLWKLAYERGKNDRPIAQGFRGGKIPPKVNEIKIEVTDRPKGEWIGEGDGYADGEIVYDTWYCSKCDHCEEGEELALPNYCPNCGADMRGDETNGR